MKSRITIISEFHRTAVHEKLGSAFQSIMSVNLGHMLLKLPHSISLSVFKKKKTTNTCGLFKMTGRQILWPARAAFLLFGRKMGVDISNIIADRAGLAIPKHYS